MTLRRCLAVTLLASLFALPTAAQVSVSIGQPGFFGRLDIGGYPAPALIYPEPMIIRPAPVAVAPLYLRVPPRTAGQPRLRPSRPCIFAATGFT